MVTFNLSRERIRIRHPTGRRQDYDVERGRAQVEIHFNTAYR